MKTINLKKILTLISIVVIMIFSSPMLAQALPGGVDDVNDEVPIDQDIWLGIIVGCLISAYFVAKKQKMAYSK